MWKLIKYLLLIWKVKDLKKFVSKVLLLSIILNIFTTSISLAYDNIDRYSKGSILIDQLTNRTLYEKNPDKKMPLASLSKMMTFLIAIESIKEGKVKENDIKKTALIMVGEFLGTTYNNSKLYDKDFKHEYRK